MPRYTTVNIQSLPRNNRRLITRQERHDIREVFWRLSSFDRLRWEQVLEDIALRKLRAGRALRCGQAYGYGIDRDPMHTNFRCKRSGKTDHTHLTRDVMHKIRRTEPHCIR